MIMLASDVFLSVSWLAILHIYPRTDMEAKTRIAWDLRIE